MGRGLFLLLISNLIGVVLSSGVLMATDDVAVDIASFDAVETVEIVEPAQPAEIEPSTPVEPVAASDMGAGQVASYVAPSNAVQVTNYVAPVNYTNSISIAGQTLEVIDVTSEKLDAGYHVNRLGGKFLYGHNSSAVFGGLVNMGVGSTFSINNSGVVTNYQVMRVEVFEKNNGKLQKNGQGSFMNTVADASYMGQSYSLSIMTCAGQAYGNGDASHRLVLFANAV